jgi:2-aminoadipate transaminase
VLISLRRIKVNTIDFSRGVPAVKSFPMEKLAEAMQRAFEKHGATMLQYGSAMGFLPLREWIAQWQQCSVEEVLISNGSLQILDFFCEAMLNSGDTVFVESPTYDRTLTILRRRGINIVGIPLQEDGPNIEVLLESLERVHPAFFYIIPYFQNPTGITWSRAKRFQVADLARSHGFTIFEDSPYRFLRYRGMEEEAFSNIAPDRVLRISSFTKLIAAGIRVGFLLADSDIIQKVGKVAGDTYISPCFVSQAMVFEWCQADLLGAQLVHLRQLYSDRLDACLRALDEFLPDCVVARPEGGFFVSLWLPKGVSGESVRSAADSHGVVLTDGRGFFPNPEDGQNFLRLPFCALPPEDIREGVRRLAHIIHDHGV